MPRAPHGRSAGALSPGGGPATSTEPGPARVQVGSPSRTNAHGLLIIRAWVEEGSDERLRAEVRVTNDVSAGIQRTVTLARAEEVRTTVEAWLADVLSGSASAGPARRAGR